MKTVMVTGDLIQDVNVVRLSNLCGRYALPNPVSCVNKALGGAWFLSRMIESVCEEGASQVLVPDPKCTESLSFGAHSIWKGFPLSLNSKESKNKSVWRCDEFIGCESPSGILSEDAKLAVQFSDVPRPELLVIDDLCLKFRHCNELWPKALYTTDVPILLKTASPLVGSPLWTFLADGNKGRLKTLTITVSVSALRSQGAQISRSLSWDKTLEDLKREFSDGEAAYTVGLASRVFVRIGREAVAVFRRKKPGSPEIGCELERMYFEPTLCEDGFKDEVPGETFGALSVLTASVARHVVWPEQYPLSVAMGRALAGMQKAHEIGCGDVKPDASNCEGFRTGAVFGRELQEIWHPKADVKDAKLPERRFGAVFLPDVFSTWNNGEPFTMLSYVAGQGYEYLYAKALEIVQCGLKRAMPSVPRAQYGQYVTVDREEIERINDLRNLILSYKHNAADTRPLSIAVFGQPGSGKSFAIKQLAKSLFGEGQDEMVFNLTQFSDAEEVCEALQKVRNASIKGKIPLVFWDEFDTDNLRWLKEFLAPMQDAEFCERGSVYSLGRCIFVFAGGTSASFQAFDACSADKKDKKCPDFISRLRGYLDVKGPNPSDDPSPSDITQAQDLAHVIRRSVLLRSLLERHASHLIGRATGLAKMDSRVIRAFLRVSKFCHGARSMESLLTMSAIKEAEGFELDTLPSQALRRLHVPVDFDDLLVGPDFNPLLIEDIAEALHTVWFERKKRTHTYDPVTNDEARTNCYLLPYSELDEAGKDRNRLPVRNTLACLVGHGYAVFPQNVLPMGWEEAKTFEADELESLARDQHDIWLRMCLSKGYIEGADTNDRLLVHKDAVHFDRVCDADKQYDRDFVMCLPGELLKRGYKLVRRTPCVPARIEVV